MQLVGKLVVLLVKTLNGHAWPVTAVMGARKAMTGRTVPRSRDASTSVFHEVETSACELTSGIKIGVRCGPLAETLVPVHVESPAWYCGMNVTIANFNSMYKKGTAIPYIDYVAQQHEEGSVICEWLAVATASVSCKI